MNRGRIGFVALEAVLLLAVPLLGWLGFRTVLHTTEGQAVDPELDPEEPGYEAFVEPTPVALLVGVDEPGELSWLTVLVLGGADQAGGSVLFVPPATVVPGGSETLADVFADGGQPAITAATGELLGAGFAEVFVVEPDRVAALVAPVTPLQVTIADEIPGFEAGQLGLDGDRVAALLLTGAEGETDLARLVRHEVAWRSWLAAISASPDPDAVPGEAASGIGRYVRALAEGAVSIDTVPVSTGEDDDGAEVFELDVDGTRSLVAERVPFPVGAQPGSRTRVRVLDGVGHAGLALQVARDAVRAGGQVTVIGNADRFGATVSKLVYFDAAVADAAAALADALGVAQVERGEGPNPNDLVDVTVVVGTDLAGAYGFPGG